MKEYKKDLFSIIVPCYNHEKFLSDFFESIFNQTYDNIELLICDDCSSDNSIGVIKEYEKIVKEKLENVVVLRNEENLGIVKTLNKLIIISRGEFVKIIASDDMLDTNYCSEVYKQFSSDINIDVVVTNGWMVPEKTKYHQADTQFELFYKDEPDFKSNDLFTRMYEWNRVFAPGACYRASVYERFGLYDENILIEDWEYSCRLAYNNCLFTYINKPLCYYRVNQNSASSKVINKGIEKRRIDYFNSEIGIIEKYGKYVDRKLYITKKVIYIFGYYDFARKNKMKKLKKEVRQRWYTVKDIIEFGIRKYFMLVYRNIKGRIVDKFKDNKK